MILMIIDQKQFPYFNTQKVKKSTSLRKQSIPSVSTLNFDHLFFKDISDISIHIKTVLWLIIQPYLCVVKTEPHILSPAPLKPETFFQ